MANVICPNCGEKNPSTAELCQFCSTPLKPNPEIPPVSGTDMLRMLGDQGQGEDVPEWLRSLRPEEDAPAEDVESEPASDWMSEEPAASSSQPDAGEADDWLARLETSQPPSEPAAPQVEETGAADIFSEPEEIDWEASLAQEFGPGTPLSDQPIVVDETGGESFDEALDWLSNLEGETPPSQEEQSTAFPSAGETGAALEWAEQGAGATSDELFSETQPESEDLLRSAAAPLDESEQEWLRSLTGATQPGEEVPSQEFAAQPAASDEETSDWLASLRAQDVGISSEEESEQEASLAPETEPGLEIQPGLEPAAELDATLRDQLSEDEDWLSSLQGSAAAPFDAELPEGEAAEQPDWLSRLGSEGIEAAEDVTPATAGEDASEAAAWFTPEVPSETLPEIEGIPSGETPGVSPFTFDAEEEGEAGEFQVDWFQAASEEPAPESQPAGPQEDLPDWLRQAGESEVAFFATQPAESETPNWLQGSQEAAPPQEETPAWLGESDEEVEPAAETNFSSFETEDGVVPDWLSRLDLDASTPAGGEGAMPAFILDEEPLPFGGDQALESEPVPELEQQPDWLDQISGDQILPMEEPISTQEGDASLAPAELPEWLEAMRPSREGEGIFRDTSDDRVEAAGLLAGVPGILPSGGVLDRVTKPPVYSIKLQVAQEQQDRVDMLKALMDEEEQVAPTPAASAIPTAYILRLLILGAFIFAVVFAFLAGFQQTPVPEAGSIPQPVLDLRTTLDALPNGEPVLVVFGYEPASIPEMETAALGVIDQLVLKGSVIRAVSTNNSGPALAKRLLTQAVSMPDRVQLPPLDMLNLGYIPGGAAGLRSFANDPAGLMRYSLEAAPNGSLDAWLAPTFNADEGLANFKLVLVITDNADTARSWVEQVGPGLQAADIPLLMVVSAQAEPMVRPYYDTYPRQVDGIVTGVMGGLFIESLNGRAGPARTYLDAYSLSLMVAVALLVVGSLVNLVTSRLAQRKQLKGEGQA